MGHHGQKDSSLWRAKAVLDMHNCLQKMPQERTPHLWLARLEQSLDLGYLDHICRYFCATRSCTIKHSLLIGDASIDRISDLSLPAFIMLTSRSLRSSCDNGDDYDECLKMWSDQNFFGSIISSRPTAFRLTGVVIAMALLTALLDFDNKTVEGTPASLMRLALESQLPWTNDYSLTYELTPEQADSPRTAISRASKIIGSALAGVLRYVNDSNALSMVHVLTGFLANISGAQQAVHG